MRAWTPRYHLPGLALVLACLALLAVAPPSARAAITAVGQTSSETGLGAASVTVNKPAGTQAGDLLLINVRGAGGTAIPTPAGWSVHYSLASFYGYSASFYKVAGAGEPASYTLGLGASRRAIAEASAWRGVDPVSPIDATSYTGNSSGTSATALSATTSWPCPTRC